MYKKDYLDRQFEEFGKVMATLFGLRKSKDFDVYEKEMLSAFLKYTSFKIESLESLNIHEFIERLSQSKDLSTNQMNMLADLLYEKLHFYLEQNKQEQARDLADKCHYLYTEINSNATLNEYNLSNHYRLNFLQEFKSRF